MTRPIIVLIGIICIIIAAVPFIPIKKLRDIYFHYHSVMVIIMAFVFIIVEFSLFLRIAKNILEEKRKVLDLIKDTSLGIILIVLLIINYQLPKIFFSADPIYKPIPKEEVVNVGQGEPRKIDTGKSIKEDVKIDILSPKNNDFVDHKTMVNGIISDNKQQVFVLARNLSSDHYAVGPIPFVAENGKWQSIYYFGRQKSTFQLMAVSSLNKYLFRRGDHVKYPLPDDLNLTGKSSTFVVKRGY